MVALAMYYDKYGYFPGSDNQGCGGWDTPGDGDFIHALVTENFLPKDISDPSINGTCGNYRYYRYPATGGWYNCGANFYVLEVNDMESSGNPYPGSPGWSCGGYNWQVEGDWVAGSFE